MAQDITGGLSLYDNTAKIVNSQIQPQGTQGATGETDTSFSSMVFDTLDSTRDTMQKAEYLSSQSLVDNVSMEELAIAVNNAEVTLKTVVAVRDRIIAAYQDIIKMPV